MSQIDTSGPASAYLRNLFPKTLTPGQQPGSGNTGGWDVDRQDALDSGTTTAPKRPQSVTLNQDVISALINLVQTSDASATTSTGSTSSISRPPSAADRFKAMDTDGEGAPAAPKGAYGHHHDHHGAPPPASTRTADASTSGGTDTTATASTTAGTTTAAITTDATATSTIVSSTSAKNDSATSALSVLRAAIKNYASYDKLTLDPSSMFSTTA